MRRTIRAFIALCFCLPLVMAVGCGKDEGKPNPELKVPDIQPVSSKDGKGDMSNTNPKKK